MNGLKGLMSAGGFVVILSFLVGCQTVDTDKYVETQVTLSSIDAKTIDNTDKKEVDFSDKNITGAINIYGNVVTHPMPLWFNPQSESEIFEQSKVFRNQKGPQFIYEQIPTGQDFENWEQIYVISGVFLGRDIPTQKVIDLSLADFKQGCLNRDVRHYQVLNPENTVVVFCEEFNSASVIQGTKKRQGEIMVRRQFMSGGAVVSVSHEWRGQAFNYGDTASWPATEAEINAVLERFKTIRVMHPSQFGAGKQ